MRPPDTALQCPPGHNVAPLAAVSPTLCLERLNRHHIEPLANLANDPRIAATSGVPSDCAEQDVAQWLRASEAHPPTELHFVMLTQQGVCGVCSLKKLDWQRRSGELSYWLGVEFWRLGLATRAAGRLIEYAFTSLDLTVLEAHFLKANNMPSGRLLHQAGFRPDPCRADLPVTQGFEQFAGDVWTFVRLTKAQWQIQHHERLQVGRSS